MSRKPKSDQDKYTGTVVNGYRIDYVDSLDARHTKVYHATCNICGKERICSIYQIKKSSKCNHKQYNHNSKDYSGQTFGVMHIDYIDHSENGNKMYHATCTACGKEIISSIYNFKLHNNCNHNRTKANDYIGQNIGDFHIDSADKRYSNKELCFRATCNVCGKEVTWIMSYIKKHSKCNHMRDGFNCDIYVGHRIGDYNIDRIDYIDSRGTKHYHAICTKCGRERVCDIYKIKHASMCNCDKHITSDERVGQTFGDWHIDYIDHTDKYRNINYHATCTICGKEKIVPFYAIKKYRCRHTRK